MSQTNAPLEPPILGPPITSRHSSDGDRTAVPTPTDSRSIREESQSSGSDSSPEKGKGVEKAEGKSEQTVIDKAGREQDGEKDGWSYGKQLKVSPHS